MSNETMVFLREFFADRLISKKICPPRSPDLTSPDYFLWGHLKGLVYQTNPHTLDELKANTETAIANITVATLHKVSPNMVKRVRACIHENGSHFEHML